MKIYDNNKYGMWLPVFWAEMSTLPPDVTKYMKELFANNYRKRKVALLYWLQ